MTGAIDPRFMWSAAEAERRQEAYRESRKAWARATGRPYPGDDEAEDLRPPPGEIDNVVGPQTPDALGQP